MKENILAVWQLAINMLHSELIYNSVTLDVP